VEGEEDVMSGHFIRQCKHGRLVTQCRCFSKDKRVEIVACVSRACLDEGAVNELTERPQDETISEHIILSKQPPTKETDEYEWPLTGDRLKMWGQDS
jgi:hypothetical protein